MKQSFRNSYLSYTILYTFYFLSMALSSSFISVYLLHRGYSASQISIVVSASFFISLILHPWIGYLFDHYEFKRLSLIMFVLSIASALLFILSKSFLVTLLLYSALVLFVGGNDTIIERIATGSPFSYGKIRIWGTIGYALGTQFSGVLFDAIAPEAIYIAFVIATLICMIGFFGIEPKLNFEETEKDTEPVSISSLFKNKKFLYYLLLTALITGVISVGHTYIPAMLTTRGLKASHASTILSIAAICEAPFVLFSSRFMDRFSNKTLLAITLSILLLQTGIYAIQLSMPLEILATLIGKQLPDMLTIMINLKIVNTIIDHRQQMLSLSVLRTVRSFASIILNNVAGRIIDTSGYTMMYQLMFGILVLSAVLLYFYKIPSGNHQRLFTHEESM
ncbi:MAG: MFS transporter [Solobacterium sp.]|nr:MFS transporter [Solobacterium sp.]